ncbi:hypothetical protein [Actinorugispora endophytica]|uniref:Uncharacterized protein n=1 Tax=Actinorugispora endophytica TaxID=1605990 RepID=A0A4R6URN8_9ACTN|nr:hypothetical protein [Actinorugispora endophytica]TDQ45974.1 hypothetical protein EV190_12732 [Actinorugispora endophytica]
MPCYLCGARPSDPARGARPWKRGVRHERQVLICPDCLVSRDWKADLDRCGRCRSTFLISRLGEIECHGCGEVRPQAAPQPAAAPLPGSALTNEVEQALSRALSGLTALPAPHTRR